MTTSGEVSRREKITLRGTDPEPYITEHTLVSEEYGRDLTSTVPRASPRAVCTVLLDPRDPLLQSERRQGFTAGLVRKGEVFACAGLIHNLKDLKVVSWYVACVGGL